MTEIAKNPAASNSGSASETDVLVSVYRSMFMSRRVDEIEEDLAHRGEVPFYLPASGHESIAALNPHLTEEDYLHLHYRDKALALARGIQPEDMFYSLFGMKESNSSGRRMPCFPSNRELKILSAPTVVGNNATQADGIAAAIKNDPGSPIVYCGMGDGSTQQGEVHEAINEAVRSNLPVLFLIEDNNYALSTKTAGNTFYSLPSGEADQYMGLPLHRVDGTDTPAVYRMFGERIAEMRKTRGPQIIIMKVERLCSHTNSDDHRVYRSEEDIKEMWNRADPLVSLRDYLLDQGIEEDALLLLEQEVNDKLKQAEKTARTGTSPTGVPPASRPLPAAYLEKEEYSGSAGGGTTMLEAMRGVLKNRLAEEGVSMFGEDICDPKGDVFGLTRGLSTALPDKVINAPLAEATILGMSIGRALAGEKPVAHFQFSDFMPVAFNQLFSELAPMFWRSNEIWSAPVISMAICGGYRPGLGPYHAQSPTAYLAHTPGLDVMVPSTAGDAAGLLNAAFESGRPTVFLYPKTLINDRERTTSDDLEKQFVPVGKARIDREGQHLTIVSWGSTMPICEKVADALKEEGIYAEIIDLRSISPWDKDTVLASAEKTGRLLVVHEDHITCGFGAEILAAVSESASKPVSMARVAQADSLVPYHFGSQLEVLPSFKKVLEKAADMVGFDISWEEAAKAEAGKVIVNAIGSSPSDESVRITELHAAAGDEVTEGQIIASVEADKTAMEIASPVKGVLEELFLSEGDQVKVGTPLARIATEEVIERQPSPFEEPARPKFERRMKTVEAPQVATTSRTDRAVLLSTICHALGSRVRTNDDLAQDCAGWTSEDVMQRTGIARRHWIAEGESALTLGVDACRKLLDKEKLKINEIDAIICSTGTPPSTTPSLACRILKELSPDEGELLMPAHDINAACSGYLYALQQAYDMLKFNPDMKILLVTSETLSPVLNKQDPSTYFLFGDAATASLLSSNGRRGDIHAEVKRPVLSALGSEEKILYVPSIQSDDFVMMDGKPVFRTAVRKMIDMLEQACAQEGITVDELDMIVPHQANERIMEAIRKAIKFPTDKVFYYIRDYGNTSSNTIPLSLEAILPKHRQDDMVGLTAFGGGFTFAAGVLKVL